MAARVQEALSVPFVVEGVDLTTEASIGAVVSGLHGDDASTLFQHADIAMYVAKEEGRRAHLRPRRATSTARAVAAARRSAPGARRDELLLHYQPRSSIEDRSDLRGRGPHFRWQHPTRGLVPPDEFIPIAEHTALIGPLTGRSSKTALAQVADVDRRWPDASPWR